MISISAFVISLSGIISLLYFRLWEIKRGERLFNSQRNELDEKVISFKRHIENHVPTFDQAVILHSYHFIVHHFALVILSVVKSVERKMVFLLEHIRGKREIQKGVTQSEFLKRVKDHKQSFEKPSKDAIE